MRFKDLVWDKYRKWIKRQSLYQQKIDDEFPTQFEVTFRGGFKEGQKHTTNKIYKDLSQILMSDISPKDEDTKSFLERLKKSELKVFFITKKDYIALKRKHKQVLKG